MLVPDYYTEKEGGLWEPFPACAEIAPELFHVAPEVRSITLNVGGKALSYHALCFGDYQSNFSLKWDLINGFRKQNHYGDM